MNLQGMQIWMVTPRSDTPVGHRGQIKVKLRSNLEIAENLTNLLNQSGTYKECRYGRWGSPSISGIWHPCGSEGSNKGQIKVKSWNCWKLDKFIKSIRNLQGMQIWKVGVTFHIWDLTPLWVRGVKWRSNLGKILKLLKTCQVWYQINQEIIRNADMPFLTFQLNMYYIKINDCIIIIMRQLSIREWNKNKYWNHRLTYLNNYLPYI